MYFLKKDYKIYLYLSFFILYLLTIIFEHFVKLEISFLKYILSVITILTLLFSLPMTKGIIKVFTILFLTFGILTLFIKKASILCWLSGFTQMIDIIALFIVIKLMSVPYEDGVIESYISKALKTFKNQNSIYIAVLLITMFLGIIIHMAVVPIIYFLLNGFVKQNCSNPERFIGTCIKRGFTFSLLWSPLGITMAIATELTNSEWIRVFPFGISLALLGIILTIFTEKPYFKNVNNNKIYEVFINNNVTVNSKLSLSIITNILYPMSLIFLVLYMSNYLELGMIRSLFFISLLSPFLWMLFIKKNLIVDISKKIINELTISQPYIALFISLGLFTQGLRLIGIESYVNQILVDIQLYLGNYGLLMTIFVVIIILSVIGIYPIVSVIMIAQSISYTLFDVSPELFAIIFVAGANISGLLSPWISTSVVLAGLVGRSPFEITIKWNIFFVFLFILLTPFVLMVISYFL